MQNGFVLDLRDSSSLSLLNLNPIAIEKGPREDVFTIVKMVPFTTWHAEIPFAHHFHVVSAA